MGMKGGTSMTSEPEKKILVGVIEDIQTISNSFPRGELLVEMYPDGQLHVAFREWSWDRWNPGSWGIIR